MKKHRIYTGVIAMLVAATLCFGTAFAYGGGGDSVNASTTLAMYGVVLTQGENSGEIYINYNVRAKRVADSVGVSTLKIYKSTGTLVATITGSTTNGLIVNNSSICFDDYTFTGTPGTSYYATATVFAEIGSDYDSHTIMTNTVTAPGP